MVSLNTARNAAGAASPRRSTWGIVALCGLLIMADGYDLVVYGNVVPALLTDPVWQITPAAAGQIASAVLVGMLLGALGAGILADRIGRRRLVIAAAMWFSASMVACALAPSPELFAAFRALGGLGLGAMFPVVTAVIMEFAPSGRKALAYTLSFVGYLAGGVIAGVLGIVIIAEFGWRWMFWIGAFPILLLPLILLALPESPAWLAARGREQEAHAIADRYGISVEAQSAPRPPRGAIFRDGYLSKTLINWALLFCSLMLVGGMISWLPGILVSLGYDLRSALVFAVVLNAGAVVGALVGSRFADRGASGLTVMALFLLGAVALGTMATGPNVAVMFVLIAFAGAGTLGTQILVNVIVGSTYPTLMRGTGLGWGLAVGRIGMILGPIVAGALLSSSLPPQASFWFFAAVGLAGAVVSVPFVARQRGARNVGPSDALGSTR